MDLMKTFMERNGVGTFTLQPELQQEDSDEEIVYEWEEGDAIESE